MLRNYFKTIFRNIRRNRTFTLINIFGLSLGLAAFISITQYVRYESGYDQYAQASDRIVRLGMRANLGNGEIAVPFFGAPVAATLKADMPEVEDATRIHAWTRRDYFVKRGDLELKEKQMTRLFGDANFFEFFNVPLVVGNESTALAEPNSVVITESTAERYFGANWRERQIQGELLEIENLPPLQITGISADVPAQSHFHYNLLISLNTLPDDQDPHWLSNAIYHYLRLNPEADADQFVAKVQAKAPDYLKTDMKDFLGTTYDDFFSNETTFFEFFAQPLESIHLESGFELELAVNGDKTYVTVFSIVSALVLLMASINFMNLSTVSGLKRYKEVGVRKVLGSLKAQLVSLFLLESCLVVFISVVLAITAVQLAGPWVNNTLGLEIIPGIMGLLDLIVWLVAGGVFLGILSGLYPAILLSSLNTIKAFRGGNLKGKGNSWFRNGLIVFQFAVSLVLIIGVTGISNQVTYMRSSDLGYDRDQVLVIHDVNELGDRANALKDALSQNALVSQVSLTGFVPIGSVEYGMSGYRTKDQAMDQTVRMRSAYADAGYLDTYGIELVAGRDFSAENENEPNKIIVNQRFLREWNWEADEALGQKIINIGNNAELTIIGVVQDFQITSLKESIQPFFLEYGIDNQALAVRFEADQWSQVRTDAEAAWSALSDKPFSYSLASDLFESVLQFEKQAGKLFSAFSLLAIIIGGLGLLGVASYVITQRSKEVGIRKVLGATILQLFTTLSGKFLMLIGISGILAIPLAYYLLQGWVAQYTYQTAISWLWFAVPLIMIGLIAFIIVGVQVLKVASLNPIKSLRYE